MIVTCPNCSSRFQVEASALGPSGRTVRCGSCQHSWHQVPVEEAPEPAVAEIGFEEAGSPESPPPPPVAVAEPEPPTPAEAPSEPAEATAAEAPAPDAPASAVEAIKAERGEKAPAKKKPMRLGRIVLWLAFAFVVAALVTGLYRYRQFLVNRWPAATAIYEALGVPVTPPPSYSFQIPQDKLKPAFTGSGDTRLLTITGAITNKSAKPRPVPEIRVLLIDAKGAVLQKHAFKVGKSTLGPGETAPFNTRIAKPAPAAEKVEIRMFYPATKGASP